MLVNNLKFSSACDDFAHPNYPRKTPVAVGAHALVFNGLMVKSDFSTEVCDCTEGSLLVISVFNSSWHLVQSASQSSTTPGGRVPNNIFAVMICFKNTSKYSAFL
ncbi:hypothetical protein OUZ56_011503 [Daphnia magna]|uniref:Uncharacterized protein n=1 Tax=Daphnia magna TaxID=35525 RepID=A0ABQ9Z0A9_9CRUS|nr:hypothetical protein OUZ56_011503 [Daphnia magna]